MNHHLPHLITDLALILGAAAVSTLLFKWLKQPLVLGYIIAGFLVGPHFTLIPTIADKENVETLAEIGVIFLLFSLGLEFSFKKLIRIGGAASVTALVEIIFITVSGYFLGQLLGWTSMDSLFLGGMLASSSTTIIIRAFDELGVKTKKFAGVVFGVLIVEDIVVILLMVLLSTVAVTRAFEGGEMMFTVLKLAFFLILWFIGGIFLLPTLLQRAKKVLNDETLLILSLALCLGMVVLATVVGFSAELGAFVMGSIIAETTSAEKVEHQLKSVKDLFGAIFFTSVGMMIDPQAMVQYAGPIMAITLLTLLGKLFSTTLGAIISGQSVRQSVQVGMSMAQIGEFAFIVAALGLSLGVTSSFLFPVAVGASAITTFTTPYLIRYSEPFSQWIDDRLPERWKRILNRNEITVRPALTESEWRIYFRAYLTHIILFSSIIAAIVLLATQYFLPIIILSYNGSLALKISVIVLSMCIMAPLIWALSFKRLLTEETANVWLKSKYRARLLVLQFIRTALGVMLVALLFSQSFSQIGALVGLAIASVGFLLLSHPIRLVYETIEKKFLSNLYERETQEKKERAVELAPWDAHITYFDIHPESLVVGKTLMELSVREKFGVNIARVKRGGKLISVPGKQTVLYPYDRVYVIGTDEQIEKFAAYISPQNGTNGTPHFEQEIALQRLIVRPGSSLDQKSIRSSGIGEIAEGIVVGIERDGSRILNPESIVIFQPGDIVWVVGDKKKLQALGSPLV